MSLNSDDLLAIRSVVRDEIQGIENDVKDIYFILNDHSNHFDRFEKKLDRTGSKVDSIEAFLQETFNYQS